MGGLGATELQEGRLRFVVSMGMMMALGTRCEERVGCIMVYVGPPPSTRRRGGKVGAAPCVWVAGKSIFAPRPPLLRSFGGDTPGTDCRLAGPPHVRFTRGGNVGSPLAPFSPHAHSPAYVDQAAAAVPVRACRFLQEESATAHTPASALSSGWGDDGLVLRPCVSRTGQARPPATGCWLTQNADWDDDDSGSPGSLLPPPASWLARLPFPARC